MKALLPFAAGFCFCLVVFGCIGRFMAAIGEALKEHFQGENRW